MTNEFDKKLSYFLSSECSEYGIDWDVSTYSYVDTEIPKESVSLELESDFGKCNIVLCYDHDGDVLSINTVNETDFNPDNLQEIKDHDWTVRYFWMTVAPQLFPVSN